MSTSWPEVTLVNSYDIKELIASFVSKCMNEALGDVMQASAIQQSIMSFNDRF